MQAQVQELNSDWDANAERKIRSDIADVPNFRSLRHFRKQISLVPPALLLVAFGPFQAGVGGWVGWTGGWTERKIRGSHSVIVILPGLLTRQLTFAVCMASN